MKTYPLGSCSECGFPLPKHSHKCRYTEPATGHNPFEENLIYHTNKLREALCVGLEIMNAKRKDHFGVRRELQTSPKHIMMADTRHNLGNADMKNIDLVKLGWEDGSLI